MSLRINRHILQEVDMLAIILHTKTRQLTKDYLHFQAKQPSNNIVLLLPKLAVH